MTEPADKFTQIMRENGFEVTDADEASEITETVTPYTGLSITFATDDGFPVTVRVEFPVDHAMDAARALVLTGGAQNIKQVLAGAATFNDASVHGYLDANGIDAAAYIEDAFDGATDEAPPLSDADEFFTL